jgi:outer membrane lipoprotein SlyB
MGSRIFLVMMIVLGGCTTVSPPDQTFAFRPGYGVVQSVRAAHVAVPQGAIAGSPSAGGSYNTVGERLVRPRWTDGYQLTLRMDDGSEQAVTQDSASFRPGERVQITQDGLVLRATNPPVTQAPAPVTQAPLPITQAAPPVAQAAPPAPAAEPTVPSSTASTNRPGTGTVQSLALTQSASAGASGRSGAVRGYDLTVRMDDGTMQTLTDNSNRFRAGDRIRITTDGEMVRP